MIYYLVYLSSSTHLYSEQEIQEILLVSQKNNAQQNITGLLLYCKGSVLQVLEGDKEVVTNLYEIIKKDSRHWNVIKLVEGFNDERSFADWSMGFKVVSREEWEEYDGFFKLNKDSLLSLIKQKNERIDATVKAFVNINLSK